MRNARSGAAALLVAVSFLAGWLASSSTRPVGVAQSPAPAPTPAPKEEPPKPKEAPLSKVVPSMESRLWANLYVATAAEYRACCLQTYKLAGDRLAAVAETMKAARPGDKLAVVLDLDETVVDNSPFQSFLCGNNLDYSDDRWMRYEKEFFEETTLVPGAKAFVERAAALGVTPVFVSNRFEENREQAVKVIDRLGVAGGPNVGERVYLRPKGGSSDKTARRKAVSDKYTVVMHVGDNLRDFDDVFASPKALKKDSTPEEFARAVAERQAKADQLAAHWGVDWFILPNPMYGEWERLLGADPKARLRPTAMKP